MSLFVVATPIDEIDTPSSRAREILLNCQTIIGEELKPLRRLLSRSQIPFREKNLLQLNEHSLAKDLHHLVEICKNEPVALVSDCGTPGFCDPGSDLVFHCRQNGIIVKSVAGPSSLSAFLSVCGIRLDRFEFVGFLEREKKQRSDQIVNLAKKDISIICMDTPYRLKKTLMEIKQFAPKASLVLGHSLSCEQEQVLSGNAAQILSKLKVEKAPFILLFHNCRNV